MVFQEPRRLTWACVFHPTIEQPAFPAQGAPSEMTTSRTALALVVVACTVLAVRGAEMKQAELLCTEYCPVVYQLGRGALDRPAAKDQKRQGPGSRAPWGESN